MYFGSGMVSVDEQFEVDEYGVYSIVSSTSEIIYVPSGDGKTLTKIDYGENAESDTEEAETKEESTQSEDKTAETEAVADTEEKKKRPKRTALTQASRRSWTATKRTWMSIANLWKTMTQTT